MFCVIRTLFVLSSRTNFGKEALIGGNRLRYRLSLQSVAARFGS